MPRFGDKPRERRSGIFFEQAAAQRGRSNWGVGPSPIRIANEMRAITTTVRLPAPSSAPDRPTSNSRTLPSGRCVLRLGNPSRNRQIQSSRTHLLEKAASLSRRRTFSRRENALTATDDSEEIEAAASETGRPKTRTRSAYGTQSAFSWRRDARSADFPDTLRLEALRRQ